MSYRDEPLVTLPPQERDDRGRLIYSPRSNVGMTEEVDCPPGCKRGAIRPRLSSASPNGPSSIVGGRVPVLGSHQADA